MAKPKKSNLSAFVCLFVILAAFFGECRCVYQFFTSDFEPVGKREVVYGVGALCGLGTVIGYLDIPDTQTKTAPAKK